MTVTPATDTATTRRSRTRFAVLASDFVILALNYADRAVIGVAAPLIIAEFGFSKATFGCCSARARDRRPR